MEFIFSGETQADLLEVDICFEKSLLPWWGDISEYVPSVEEDLSFQMIPAMVLSAYRYLGLERELAIELANMFKTIYFASKIHELIGDEEEGQEYNPHLQFSILIGDYIFGRVLKLLAETHTDQLLHMFATMICQVNEGLIVKYKLGTNLEEELAQTKAPFYQYGFLSAAKMAGIVPVYEEIYGQIGHNLGLALELLDTEAEKSQGGVYLDRAGQLLELIPAEAVPERQGLVDLICLVGGEIGGSGNGL